ncbi:MAG: pyridoxamine 5'-phosphate oxidase family protein [Pseudomonadota bacterium]
MTTATWHEGERALQARVGSAQRLSEVGPRIIRDAMPEQHSSLFAQLPFMLLAAVDSAGAPWVTLIEAERLAQVVDARTLQLHALPKTGDPVRAALTGGAAVGMLGIELATRRRNRVNGSLRAVTGNGFTLQVAESFGNCSQYIRVREPVFAGDPALPYGGQVERFDGLDAHARASVAAADTFFVGSYVDLEEGRKVDVSHRGGQPGFVRVDGDVLTIPDFAGNRFFNTLGNLLVNPRAGLLFVDFSNGDVLQLMGRTELVLDGPEVGSFEGAERLWRLQVEQAVRRRGLLSLRTGSP